MARSSHLTLWPSTHGDLYVGEVSYASWTAVFPARCRSPAASAACEKFVKPVAVAPGVNDLISAIARAVLAKARSMPMNRKPPVDAARTLDSISIAVKILEEQGRNIELIRLNMRIARRSDSWAASCRAPAATRWARGPSWSNYGFGDCRSAGALPQHAGVLCSIGAGHDVIDVDACTAAGVIVCNQSGTNYEPSRRARDRPDRCRCSKKIGLTWIARCCVARRPAVMR